MNMPIMNGLAFLEQLELIDRTTKVIVMSGYADFNYASGSMKYGVVDYLLKHELSEEVISEALKKSIFLQTSLSLRLLTKHPLYVTFFMEIQVS